MVYVGFPMARNRPRNTVCRIFDRSCISDSVEKIIGVNQTSALLVWSSVGFAIAGKLKKCTLASIMYVLAVS